jgi:hypothetical protein
MVEIEKLSLCLHKKKAAIESLKISERSMTADPEI